MEKTEKTDVTIQCRDCQNMFVFTAGEQEFFSKRGLLCLPKRCPNCRLLMRFVRAGNNVEAINTVNCAQCGATTKVPFKPKGHTPVYCLLCLNNKREEQVSVASDQAMG